MTRFTNKILRSRNAREHYFIIDSSVTVELFNGFDRQAFCKLNNITKKKRRKFQLKPLLR